MGAIALHEFIAQNRMQIIDLCVEKMKAASPSWSEADLRDGFDVLLDEVARALQQEAGLPVSSPLPGASEAARHHGGSRQAGGYEIAKIATDFGSISDTVGQLATEKGVTFGAREYQVFNQCIDTAIASALERFWTQTRDAQRSAETERMGFLAHELRNALSSARMSFAILKRGELTVKSRTGDVLDRSLGRLENLINQALLAVQLHADTTAKPETMSVTRLLRDVAEAAVAERDIRLYVESRDALEADVDERLLVSAVSNLLQNALKFTKTGGRIVLRAYGSDDSIVIEIEDECGGLPPGKEEELFKPFVQKSSDKRGLGLGLSITREAVEAHGGKLSVRNLPGKGCIFAIRIAVTGRAPRSAP